MHEADSPTDRALLSEAFVTMLSHELQTPMTSIYGGVELLRRHHFAEPVTQDVLRDVAIEVERLRRLIDDLLVMVRLERGVPMAMPGPVVLHRTVELALADERRRWPDRRFVTAIPRDLPMAIADETLLLQVLHNLLASAAGTVLPSGTITIRADHDPERILLTVEDDGPRINASQRESAFDLFYRGSDPRIQATGVGLYVAQALMRVMGGSIEIGTPAQGASFELRLPRYPMSAERSSTTGSGGGATAGAGGSTSSR
jgi:K+-sensing histidine kinase KdpD